MIKKTAETVISKFKRGIRPGTQSPNIYCKTAIYKAQEFNKKI